MRSICFYLLLFLSASLLPGCDKKAVVRRHTNWNADLGKVNKNPYSLYLTYNSLPLLFPGATIEQLRGSYRMTNLGYQLRKNKGKSMLMMIGLETHFAEGEIDSLFSFVEQGHQVLLSANRFDETLLDRLQLSQSHQSVTGNNPLQHIFLKDKNNYPLPYPYKYREKSIHGHFEGKDTLNTPFYTLGMNENHDPDCIIFSMGKGKLILQAAPMAFSNYFLLQKNNKTYLNTLFSYIPEDLSNIYFSSFNYRQVDSSDWGVIWQNKATRAALLLTFLVLAVFILFEMKRRQKIIPLLHPVGNSSVAFVETIGRLYYNTKNHTNLAEKMVQHFLDFVRNNYYLNTNNLDAEFVRHLAAKSGKEISKTDTLVHHIKEVQNGVKADEAFLYSLYNQIQEFYHGK